MISKTEMTENNKKKTVTKCHKEFGMYTIVKGLIMSQKCFSYAFNNIFHISFPLFR